MPIWTKEMDACSHFEQTVNTPVWTQQPTRSRRYICDVHACQSNCHDSRLFTRIRRLLRLRCAVCNHPHRSHSRTRLKWVKSINTGTSVDEDMKKRWEAAKDQKKNTETLIATHKSALGDLSRATGSTMDELSRLVEGYDGFALSRSFSAHMEKTIKFMEQRHTDREEGASQDRLENTRCGLEQMKKKLDLLRLAKAKGRGGV